ncbi:MAG: M56 family metallopeptidase [Oscillospiraceae bacterium]|nr:M56 family metallopeptidase [Oscillospiraceae bacterium]
MMTIGWALSGAVLAGVLAALRYGLRGRIRRRLQYALWLLLAVRLVLPVGVGNSPWSVAAVLQQARQTTAAETVEAAAELPLPGMSYDRAYTQVMEELRKSGVNTAALDDSEVDSRVYQRMSSGVTVAEALQMLWLGGVAIMALWLAGGNLLFALRLRKSRVKWEDGAVSALTRLPVYFAAVDTPCLFGVVRPAIYLPRTLPREAMDYVLRHEDAHFHHGDHLWGLVRGVCLALHWFDPLVWWAAALSRRDCEMACDEAVTAAMDTGERSAYGRTLIALSCAQPGAGNLLLSATTMTGGKKGLRERIAAIAGKPRNRAAALFLLAAAVLLAVVCTFTDGQKTPSEESVGSGQETVETPLENGEQADTEKETFVLSADPAVDTPVSIEPADYGLTEAVLQNLYLPDWENMSTEAIGAWYLHTDGAGAELAAYALTQRFDQAPLDTLDYLVKLGHQKVGDDYAAVILCRAIGAEHGLRASLATVSHDFALYSTAMQQCRAAWPTGRGEQLLELMEEIYARLQPTPPTVTFGSYRQDWSAENGGVSPIEWLAVYWTEDDKALLLSRYCLWVDAYDTSDTPSTWAASTLRATLNTTFLQQAFTPAEQAKIEEATNYTPDTAAWGDILSAGPYTRDKVFLLSADEAEMLLPRPEVADAALTPYAAQSATPQQTGSDPAWWLRSPGSSPSHPAAVQGGTIIDGPRSNGLCAVRPAMWVYLNDDPQPITANAPKDCHTVYYLNDSERYSPTEAAQLLAEDFMDGLHNQEDLSFSITDYRDLSTHVYATTDPAIQSMYHLQDEEIAEDSWVVEMDVEFKYEGVISPIGPSSGQWCTSLIQGGPTGFLLARTSSEYTFQVRR